MLSIDQYINSKRIAVLYSGGADSTLLYYLVARSIKQIGSTQTLDLIIVDRFNNPIIKAAKLYETVRHLVRDYSSSLKIISVPSDTPNHLQVIKTIEQIQDNYDVILWGVNQYPADTSIRPQLDYTVNFSAYKDHPKLKLPFADYSKVDIIRTFIELGLEDILHNTHSCGRPEQTPCGLCFNCRERAWAFDQLGLEPNLGI